MGATNQLEDEVKGLGVSAYRLFMRDPVAYVLAFLLLAVVSCGTCGVMSGPLSVGFLRMVDKHQRGQPVAASDVFDWNGQFLSALLATLLLAVAVAVGSLAMVLPGLVIGFFAMFALHGIAFAGLDIVQSFKQSIQLVASNLPLALIVSVAVALLNALGSTVVVGTLLTGPLGFIAMVLTYKHLTAPKGTGAEPLPPPLS